MDTFESNAWTTCQGDHASLVFCMTGAISKMVGYPSFSTIMAGDRIAIFEVGNRQFHKLVVQNNVTINAGQVDAFKWDAVSEYMLYDRPHGERLRLRAFLEELREKAPGKYFQLSFKFSIVIDRFDGQGNAIPKLSENGKSKGRILTNIGGFRIEPFTKTGTVVNPSLLQQQAARTKPMIAGSID